MCEDTFPKHHLHFNSTTVGTWQMSYYTEYHITGLLHLWERASSKMTVWLESAHTHRVFGHLQPTVDEIKDGDLKKRGRMKERESTAKSM